MESERLHPKQPSTIRTLASIGSPPALPPGTTMPHSVWVSRRRVSAGTELR